MKAFNHKLRRKMNEVYLVQPNDLGNPIVTNIYHGVTRLFKSKPFIYVVPLSFIGVLLLYILFGSLIIKIASLLQYGF